MSPEYKKSITNLLNKQLNLELSSFYLYRACSSHCQQTKVALPGLKKYFSCQEKEELKSVTLIIDYMSRQEINIVYDPIKIDFNPGCVKDLLELSLKNELNEQENIQKAYMLADENNDYDVCEFLDMFIKGSAEGVSRAKSIITRFSRCEGQIGEFLFDQSINMFD
ncbi:hypothetical protein COBT_001258 [Conglomerata obtusa]